MMLCNQTQLVSIPNDSTADYAFVLRARDITGAALNGQERFGDKVVPFKYEQTKFGEGTRFDIEKALRAIIGAYGLTGAARLRRIHMAQATDGFPVTKRTTLMMGGVKMQDAGGVCPITGLPIILEDPKDMTAQSQTKESMKLHRPIGLYLRDCGDETTNPVTGFMPLDIAVNSVIGDGSPSQPPAMHQLRHPFRRLPQATSHNPPDAADGANSYT
eukprot:scaffold790_cov30-Attheya_sp.AAC.1